MPDITNEISCPKEAALRVLLARLEDLDGTMSARSSFASGIIINQLNQVDAKVFTPEIHLIKTVLGIAEKEEAVPSQAPPSNPPLAGLLDEL